MVVGKHSLNLRWLGAIAVLLLSITLIPVLRGGLQLHAKDSKSKRVHAMHKTDQTKACDELAQAFPHMVFFSPQEPFVNSIASYNSMQETEVIPQCVVKPADSKEVSKLVKILNQQFSVRNASTPLHFAIRSGGHAAAAGAANIEGGITIDLSLINAMHVSADRKSTKIGTGARWKDVYGKLDPMNLGVAGGRNARVGVGGLVLGGGLSFHSPRTGFVCDNIVDFEVVLSDGSIVNANETLNRDLWVALKGGSNNFGIVTQFTALLFPSNGLWGGFNYHPGFMGTRLLKAFHEFAEPKSYDEYASSILAFGYVAKYRSMAIANNIQYSKPVKNPACFKKFNSLFRFWSTVKIRSMSSATGEQDASDPAGFRQLFYTTTIENNLDVLLTSRDLLKTSISHIKNVKGLYWFLIFQPLPPSVTSKGNNPFGITTDKTLVNILVSARWDHAEDDGCILSVARNLIHDIESRAQALGVAHSYKYLNYANPEQDPIAGYGAENYRFLQDMSRKYDPQGLFQTACVGGFKLFNATVA
ncbi:MAG: hypothetical protein M1831_003759 [Alyxoria varia]|nr:MAG: hypothetical protein M1831_003759 [Alyxoria varia]